MWILPQGDELRVLIAPNRGYLSPPCILGFSFDAWGWFSTTYVTTFVDEHNVCPVVERGVTCDSCPSMLHLILEEMYLICPSGTIRSMLRYQQLVAAASHVTDNMTPYNNLGLPCYAKSPTLGFGEPGLLNWSVSVWPPLDGGSGSQTVLCPCSRRAPTL